MKNELVLLIQFEDALNVSFEGGDLTIAVWLIAWLLAPAAGTPELLCVELLSPFLSTLSALKLSSPFHSFPYVIVLSNRARRILKSTSLLFPLAARLTSYEPPTVFEPFATVARSWTSRPIFHCRSLSGTVTAP